jgi:hypothetical protein
MRAEKIKVTYVPIEKLKENPDNARVHGSEVEDLANSIERVGFVVPMQVLKDYTIIAGHGRLLAAREAGETQVPVIVLPFTEDEARAFGLMDNQIHDKSTWDYEKYQENLKILEDLGWDMSQFGFDLPEFDDISISLGDEEEPSQEEPEVKTGGNVRETFDVIINCRNKEEQDKVLAFILENEIPGRLL